MYLAKREVELQNGKTVILKSPEPEEAEAVLEHLRITSEETYFMARYPEEIVMTVEEEKEYIKKVNAHEDNILLSAYLDGEMVGSAGIQRVADLMKYRHRGEFGISVKKKAWNLGVGRKMIEELLEQAKNTGFEQIELTVFEDNQRAISLYEKIGFVHTGRLKGAYKLKGNQYCDEIRMVYQIQRQR